MGLIFKSPKQKLMKLAKRANELDAHIRGATIRAEEGGHREMRHDEKSIARYTRELERVLKEMDKLKRRYSG